MSLKKQFRKLLMEMSFYDVDYDEILNDKFIRNYIDNGDADNIINWFQQINDLEDEDEDIVKDSTEFFEFIKQELTIHLEEAKENIYHKIDDDNGTITLYRAMTVKHDWLTHLEKEGNRLGIYWSWDENAAEPHWGYSNTSNTVLIEIEINEKHINWKETLEMNLHPNYSEEKEIRLFKNTPIKIKSIKLNDEYVNISNIKDKIFKA
jgi:hypothetical protein